MKRLKEFLAKHPHIGHGLHHCCHVVYFAGVAIANYGKFYGVVAGILAVVGAVAVAKGGDP